MKTFKIGLIGTGRMAKEHMKVISNFKNFHVVSILNRKKKNAEYFLKNYKIKNYFNNLKKFCKIEYDLILVCVPPDQNYKILCDLVNLNTNIFTEKPIGLNLNQANKLMSICKLNKMYKKIYVGYNRRFLGSVVHAKKIIEKKNLKRIIKITDQQDTINAKKNGHSKLTIRNWEYANAIHTIDLLNVFCRGIPKKVESSKFEINKNKFIISSKILFNSGDIALYTGFWNIFSRWSVNLEFKDMKLELSPLEEVKINSKSLFKHYTNFRYEKVYKPGFYLQFLEIEKMLKKKTNKLVNFEQGIKSIKLINKIYSDVK